MRIKKSPRNSGGISRYNKKNYFNAFLYPQNSPFKNFATLAIVVEDAHVSFSICL